ncbi:hypothetical protein ACU81Q_14645 [Komagataeibacter melomenusus]
MSTDSNTQPTGKPPVFIWLSPSGNPHLNFGIEQMAEARAICARLKMNSSGMFPAAEAARDLRKERGYQMLNLLAKQFIARMTVEPSLVLELNEALCDLTSASLAEAMLTGGQFQVLKADGVYGPLEVEP